MYTYYGVNMIYAYIIQAGAGERRKQHYDGNERWGACLVF